MTFRFPHKIRIANGYYRYIWESVENDSWGRVSKIKLTKNSPWLAIRASDGSSHIGKTRQIAVEKATNSSESQLHG